MPARKSRQSRSKKLGRNRYGSRPPPTRKPLSVLVIVCDDTRTAVSYFNEVQRTVKDRVALKVVKCGGTSPDDVIELAKEYKKSLQAKGVHDKRDQDSVWALIDIEQAVDRQAKAYEAQRVGRAAGIQVVLSNPCYELWTLLHLVDTGEEFPDCNGVLAKLKLEWKRQTGQDFENKAQADYSKIIAKRAEAARRARMHHAKEPRDPAWTEVYKLSDAIDAALNSS